MGHLNEKQDWEPRHYSMRRDPRAGARPALGSRGRHPDYQNTLEAGAGMGRRECFYSLGSAMLSFWLVCADGQYPERGFGGDEDDDDYM